MKLSLEEARRRFGGPLDISAVYKPGYDGPLVPIGPGREYLQWLEDSWKK